jgi:hypothetical protein
MENNSKEERIERLAKMIVERFGMGTPALFLLEMYKPAAFVGGELGKVLLYPWLPLFGTSSEQIAREYIDLLEDRENLEKLLNKIEEFMGEKKRK